MCGRAVRRGPEVRGAVWDAHVCVLAAVPPEAQGGGVRLRQPFLQERVSPAEARLPEEAAAVGGALRAVSDVHRRAVWAVQKVRNG